MSKRKKKKVKLRKHLLRQGQAIARKVAKELDVNPKMARVRIYPKVS